MIDKRTKVCPLELFLTTGVKLTGHLPVPANTSTSVRPTDAIRHSEGEYMLLCDVTIEDGDKTYEKGTLLVRCNAISHIEFSATQWVAPPGAEAVASCFDG